MQKQFSNIKNILLLKYLAVNIYPKYLNIGSTEEVVYSRKKEGLVKLYTLDTGEGLTKIMDGRQLQSRRWIRRKKKRSLIALKEIQKKSFFFQGCTIILNRKKELLSAKLAQEFQINALVPFNSFSCSSSYVMSTSHFFTALNRKRVQSLLFLLKPLKGGYKIYYEGVVGFLRKRQGKKLFKVLARDYRRMVAKKKIKYTLKYDAGIFSTPILCCYFPKFRIKAKFAGFYSKKKFVKAKTKKIRLRIRAKLRFVFRFFKLKKINKRYSKIKSKKKNSKKKIKV